MLFLFALTRTPHLYSSHHFFFSLNIIRVVCLRQTRNSFLAGICLDTRRRTADTKFYLKMNCRQFEKWIMNKRNGFLVLTANRMDFWCEKWTFKFVTWWRGEKKKYRHWLNNNFSGSFFAIKISFIIFIEWCLNYLWKRPS